MSKYLIALDDGHGMDTAGKRTPYIPELVRFIHENEFNRAVVNFLDAELKRCGFETLIVAPGDGDTSLTERTNLANSKGADAFISIHFNALDRVFNGNDPEGLSIHVYPNSVEGKKLGESVLKYLKQGTSQNNKGIVESNFHVVRETNMPAMLSENGFMDNKREALLMVNVDFQKEVAKEHAQGICDYFKIQYVVKPVVIPSRSRTVLVFNGNVLRLGSKGTGVKSVQQRLNALGFDCGKADSDFGKLTRAAVIKFQKSKKIKADGLVGKITWEKLFN